MPFKTGNLKMTRDFICLHIYLTKLIQYLIHIEIRMKQTSVMTDGSY